MSSRYTLRDLIEKIAQAQGIPTRLSDQYVRAFFETIVEGLESDNIVKIKRIGTFKLVTVNERSSVDVNTGESIRIESHRKISFTPDERLKEIINKPFELFQTVIVEEDVKSDELNAIGETETADIPEENAEQETVISTPAEEPSDIVEEPSDISEKKSDISEKITDISTEKSDISEAPSEESESTAATLETETEETPEEKAQPTSDTAETNETEVAPEEIPEETAATEEPVEEKSEEPTATKVSAEEKTEKPIVTEEPAKETTEEAVATPLETNEEAEEKRTNPWKIVSLILAAILIALLGYWAGYNKVFFSDSTSAKPQQPIETTDAVKNDSVLASDTTDTLSAEPFEDAEIEATTTSSTAATPKKPVFSSKILALPERNTHVVKRGETLMIIAEKEYGDKKYAKYIIEYNRIENPDIIEKGAELKIPEIEIP